MKRNKSLVVAIGPGELHIRLKLDLRDGSLPRETVDLLVTVVIEALLKDANVAALSQVTMSMPNER